MKILLMSLAIFQMNVLLGQDFSGHNWKNRVLLIKFTQDESDEYLKQIKELRDNQSGLTERKIVVYYIRGNLFKKGLEAEGPWDTLTDFKMARYFKKTKTNLSISLIGLDGGVKMKESGFLSCKRLFFKIDSMPMRASELMTRGSGG